MSKDEENRFLYDSVIIAAFIGHDNIMGETPTSVRTKSAIQRLKFADSVPSMNEAVCAISGYLFEQEDESDMKAFIEEATSWFVNSTGTPEALAKTRKSLSHIATVYDSITKDWQPTAEEVKKDRYRY
jgi:hypothetical protein